MDRLTRDTKRLCTLIDDHESWLTAHTIELAKERGYTPFTSTLEGAWRAAICCISAPLIDALSDGGDYCDAPPQAEFSRDPVANYGVEVAERHRIRGVSLGLFHGLMKGYRQAYVDVVDRGGFAPADVAHFRRMIDNFFDRMEVGICDNWSGTPAHVQLEELGAKNRAITNEKNKYLTIFESLRDPVVLVGDNGTVENMNNAAARLFLGEASPGATYYGDRRLRLRDLLGAVAVDDEILPGERQIKTSQGIRCFDVKTQRMLDVSEKYLGTVIIFADITDYRQAKDLAQAADRAKSAFLAMMSHEIRTPIHSIVGAAEILDDKALPPRLRTYAEAIVRSGNMLSSVVSDILDYSKIEAGHINIESAPFRIADVVADVFLVIRQRAARKPHLQIVFENPELPVVVGDAGKLRQILLNLLDNAVKFTDEGMVGLSIAHSAEDAGHTELTFQIRDTGIGIDPSETKSIFEPFTQLEARWRRKFEGSGLGLAICKRLAESMGGEITVESEPDEGSVFVVTLRFGLMAQAAPVPGNTTQPAGTEPARQLAALVVEDDEVNALVTIGLLERLGHRAVLAGTGAAALETLASGHFDVALVDLHLPDMSGVELTCKIRASDSPATAQIPIAGLSAYASREEAEICRNAGIRDLLFKPFRSEQLAALLLKVTGIGSPLPHDAAPWPEPAVPLLDERVLRGHAAELGFAHALKIVQVFRQAVDRMAERLEQLAANNDRDEIATVAHRLASSSQHVGLVRLSEAAAAVETAVRQRDDTLPSRVANLVLVLQKSLAALDLAAVDSWDGQPVKT